jgi:opacity protein-like surface antigen
MRTKGCCRVIIGSALLALSGLALADANSSDSGFKQFFDKNPVVVSLGGGATFQNVGQTQNVSLTPSFPNTWAAAPSNSTLATGELFMGLQSPLGENLKGQWGLAFRSSSHADLSGVIFNPGLNQNTYDYRYQLQHNALSLKGKLLLGDLFSSLAPKNHFSLIPWVSASVGLALNRATGYSDASLGSGQASLAEFGNKTTSSFTYALGAGVQYPFNTHWQVGLGYEFADWGASSLGADPTQTGSGSISQSHWYTNSVLLNVTYVH